MSSLDKNIEELEARGALTMQLLLLVIMGMFLSLHVALSFAWGGLISILSGERWISASVLYLQSWEFSRLSVGVPFVVFSIAFVKELWMWRSNDIRESVLSGMAKFARGRKFSWRELGPGDYPYQCMLQIARRAKIDIPRMFWCSLDVDNAFTISTKKEDAIVVFDKVIRDPILMPFAEATIAHEIGHIVNKDVKRDVLLGLLISIFCAIFVKGQECYHLRTRECLIMRKQDEPMFIAIISAGIFLILGIGLMLVGFIPLSWAKGLMWWRDYTAEYMADAVGAKLIADPMLMPDGMILSHVLMQGFENKHDFMDVHPPDVGRVRRFMPDFNGNWEAAARDVMRRRRISC